MPEKLFCEVILELMRCSNEHVIILMAGAWSVIRGAARNPGGPVNIFTFLLVFHTCHTRCVGSFHGQFIELVARHT